jgi:hypothetical protein
VPWYYTAKNTVGGMATWCSLKLVCSQTYHMTWTQQQRRLHSQFIMILHQHKDQPLIHSTISPQVFQNYTLETCWMGTFKASSVLKNSQPEHQGWAKKTCMIKPRNIMANTFDCVQVWQCQYHLLTSISSLHRV